MIKVSQLTGKDIYNDKGQFMGKVYDVIIDLQKGEILRLTMEPLRSGARDEAKRVFQDKTVLYKSVKAVENIVICSSQPIPEEDAGMAEEPVQSKPAYSPYSWSSQYKKF